MKRLIFTLIFLILPSAAFSVDNFYINLDEFSSEGYRKVKLAYTITNSDNIAVSYFDIEAHQSLDLEKVELEDGLTESGKTFRNVKILAGNRLWPGGTAKMKLIVRVKDMSRGNIFQQRKPDPAFTVTVYYINGEKRTWSVYPPFVADLR